MTNGVGELWKPVVNVCDLSEGERFWSALTGLRRPAGTATRTATLTPALMTRMVQKTHPGSSSNSFPETKPRGSAEPTSTCLSMPQEDSPL
jgi:hypothetical protein